MRAGARQLHEKEHERPGAERRGDAKPEDVRNCVTANSRLCTSDGISTARASDTALLTLAR